MFVDTPTILTGGSTALHHTAANTPHASETNQRIQRELRLKLMPFQNVPVFFRFEEYMKYLYEHGYQLIALRDLARYVDPQALPADPRAVIERRISLKKQGEGEK